MNDTYSILLYDGICGLCNAAVRIIIRYDRTGSLYFAPLHGSVARDILERYQSLHTADSLILVQWVGTAKENVLIKSDAVIAIASYLGGMWNFIRVAAIVPRVIRNGLYDIIARNRYRFFGIYDTCPLPLPEIRSRFKE